MRKNTKMVFTTVLSLTAVLSATFSVFPHIRAEDGVTSSNVHDEHQDEKKMDRDVRRVKKLFKEKHVDVEDVKRELESLSKNNNKFFEDFKENVFRKRPEWSNLSQSELINKLAESASHDVELSTDKKEGVIRGKGVSISALTDEKSLRDALSTLEGYDNKELYYKHMGQWSPLSSVSLDS